MRAPASATAAVALGLLTVFIACGGDAKSVQHESKRATLTPPPTAPVPPPAVPHVPNTSPPGPRLVAAGEPTFVAAVLSRSRKELRQGYRAIAIRTLYQCANRTPVQVVCEAELGMLLLENASHDAHGRYFVQAASAAPAQAQTQAPTELYRRLGNAARKHGLPVAAQQAFAIVAQRTGESSQDEKSGVVGTQKSDRKTQRAQ